MKKSLLFFVSILSVSILNGCGSGSGMTQDVATHFSVTSATPMPTAGIPFNITVTALNASGHMVATYAATVQFTSTDGQAVLPASSPLANGTATVQVTLNTAGPQFITATDTASLTGTSSSINVSAPPSPVPLVNQPLSPAAVAPGGAAFTITVNGTGFVSGSTVKWNGSVLTTTFVSESKLTANVQASDIASPSTASVTVVNPAPGGGTSNAAFLIVANPIASVSLSAPANYAAGTTPFCVKTADFNDDGKLDLAVANEGNDNVSIFLGKGDGTFEPAVNYSVESVPDSLVVGDFNHDGKLDLAVSNFTSGTVSVLLGNGDGTFQPAVSYGVGSNPQGAAVGDFNGDGKLDIVVTNGSSNSNSVSVLLGNGDGTFEKAVDYGVGTSPISVGVGDFNGDGKLDLVVANEASGNVSVLLGNGDGTFQTAVNYPAVGLNSVVVGDFNGDGKLDFAVGEGLCRKTSCPNNLETFLGNGDGTFQPGQLSPAVPFVTGHLIELGDFNGDGKLDLITANETSGSVSLFLGTGTGEFQPAVTYPIGTNPFAIAVGDFNDDGRLDIAVVSGGLTVLLQH